MAISSQVSAIWGPKKLRFLGPNPLLLAQVMDLPAICFTSVDWRHRQYDWYGLTVASPTPVKRGGLIFLTHGNYYLPWRFRVNGVGGTMGFMNINLRSCFNTSYPAYHRNLVPNEFIIELNPILKTVCKKGYSAHTWYTWKSYCTYLQTSKHSSTALYSVEKPMPRGENM